MNSNPIKIHHLADLKLIKRELEAQARRQTQMLAELAHQQTQQTSESDLFFRAVGTVKPIPDKGKALLRKEREAPQRMRHESDAKAVLMEAISDEFDVSTLLDADDLLSFCRPGMGPDVTRKLRRGDWAIQGQLDLHGLKREEAREQLNAFVREACKLGLRCVRVIHGKGLGSPGKTPILKSRVHGWLVQKQEILAFVQAKPADGGAGALLVLLAGSRS